MSYPKRKIKTLVWIAILSCFIFSPAALPQRNLIIQSFFLQCLSSMCLWHSPNMMQALLRGKFLSFGTSALGVICLSLALAKTAEPGFTNYIFLPEIFVSWKQCKLRDRWEITGAVVPIAMLLVLCFSLVPHQSPSCMHCICPSPLWYTEDQTPNVFPFPPFTVWIWCLHG